MLQIPSYLKFCFTIPTPFRMRKSFSIFDISPAFSFGLSYWQKNLSKGDDVVLVGAGMGSRMIHYGHFETEIFLRHPTADLKIRNLCDEGNTPRFRPHPSRNQEEQYAFPEPKN